MFASESGVSYFIALAGGDPCQYRHKYLVLVDMSYDISLKLDSVAYISAAESTGVSSTTFT